jgi:hypothetical protein
MRNDEEVVLEYQHYDYELMVNVHQELLLIDVDVAVKTTTMTTTCPCILVAFVHRRHTEYNKVNDDARIFIPLLAVLLMEEKGSVLS